MFRVLQNANLPGMVYLPGKLKADGSREPTEPCPEVLTAEETCRYFRLDEDEQTEKQQKETLYRYRSMNRLKGVQVGRKVVYRRIDLEAFLERQQRENPR